MIPEAAGGIHGMPTDIRPAVSPPPMADSPDQGQGQLRRTPQGEPSSHAQAARRAASPRARMLRALTRRNLS